MRYLFTNVRLPGSENGSRAYVAVDGATIAAIGAVRPRGEFDRIIDFGGDLLLPAFYNAHCHAPMTLFRGYGEDLPLQRWLNERIFPAEDRLNEERVYVGTKLAIAEMIRNGIVSFSDMYYFMDQVGQAALETGVKVNLSRSLVSFDPAADPASDARFAEARALEAWHGAGDGRIRVEMSLHAEYTNQEHYCRYMAEYAAEHGWGMHIHLSETESETTACIGRHGKTPTRFFLDTGVLNVPTVAAHCVYVNDEDMDILKEKGVTVAHCPVSNLKLGSGVMPLRKLLDKGIAVAFGTDGAASNNSLDILRELQTAAILHKGIARAPESIRASELLPLASATCAKAQGRPDCGRLEVGCRADLIRCDMQTLHNLPSYDLAATVAYSMRGDDVRMTMCDGRILYENGVYTCLDAEELRAKATEVIGHYFD